MSFPEISVLMPCYNAEDYIAATIDSIFAQTCQPKEIIAVNDGSLDNTGAILDRFKVRGVRVISQKNTGAAAARNRALFASSGEYILFLDADDLISSTHLEALASVVPKGSRCIAMSQWDRFTIEPAKAKFPWRPTYLDLPGPEWLTLDWSDGEPMTQPGMFLIPRSLLDLVGGWDERLSLIDDFEFFSRVIARSDGIRFAQQARLFYRSDVPGSLSTRRGRKAAESAYHSLMLGTANLLDVEDTPATRLAAANILQNFIYDTYPRFHDLQSDVTARILQLGGANLQPSGPPNFHKLRAWVGWRAARVVQLLAERLGLNAAARGLPSDKEV